MIGSLRGVVLERDGDSGILLEVAGVGYLVSVTPRTAAELEPGSPAMLYVHHQVREDAETLFGFAVRAEVMTFRTLIATHGVGPALAMSILATHSPAALVDIVAASDVAALTMVPGVGRKTAERLLVELRSKLALPATPTAGGPGGDRAASALADVREALSGLGYGTEEIRVALAEIPAATELDAASLLRGALAALGNRRA